MLPADPVVASSSNQLLSLLAAARLPPTPAVIGGFMLPGGRGSTRVLLHRSSSPATRMPRTQHRSLEFACKPLSNQERHARYCRKCSSRTRPTSYTQVLTYDNCEDGESDDGLHSLSGECTARDVRTPDQPNLVRSITSRAPEKSASAVSGIHKATREHSGNDDVPAFSIWTPKGIVGLPTSQLCQWNRVSSAGGGVSRPRPTRRCYRQPLQAANSVSHGDA